MRDGILQISSKLTTDVKIQRFDLKRLTPTSKVNLDLSEGEKPGTSVKCS